MTHDPMTTADLARGGDDLRGHEEENVVNRAEAEVTEPPRPEAPSLQPAPQRQAERRDEPIQGPELSSGEAALFGKADATRFHDRWQEIQSGFVDQPRKAVERADVLVAEMMKHLAEVFANERATLEHQWDRGDNVTTEDLRVTLQRYRSFFDRLLAV